MKKLNKKIAAIVSAFVALVVAAAPSFAAEVAEKTTFQEADAAVRRAIFDVPTGTKVHITSIQYPSAYLNVETEGNPQSGQTVGMWHNTGDDSQRWVIYQEAGDRRFRVCCYNHVELALNVYAPQNEQASCTVYPWATNAGADYIIKIVNESSNPIVSNRFGFVLPEYIKCLTASGGADGDNTYWQGPNNANTQLWDITRG